MARILVNSGKPDTDSSSRILKYTLIAALTWTVAVGVLLIWNMFEQRRETLETAVILASHSFEKDLVYRRWNANHGGVYVQITDDTPPNPYLSHVEDRDITTTSGKKLTLINPAYMTRQVHVLGLEQYGLRGHITSLNPIRPENNPDSWETEALQAFEQGELEVTGLETINGEPYMRLMRPMVTEEFCLKCHAVQGYKVDDVRGGISVSVPMKPMRGVSKRNSLVTGSGYILIWLLGLIGISIANWNVKKSLNERKLAGQEHMKLSSRNEAILAAVPDIIMEVNNDKTYTWSNQVGYDFFGEDVLGKEASHYFEGEQNIYQRVQPIFNGVEDVILVESWQRRKDGNKRLLAWSCKVLKDNEGNVTGVLSSARDTTEYFRAEEERKKLEVHIRHQQKLEAIGILAGGVAHEINNPINGIMNYAQLINDRLEEDSSLKVFSGNIIKETDRIAKIVSNLLTFSRQDKETHSPANVDDIINDTVSLVQTIIGRDQIILDLDIPDDLPKIRCRSQQIQQVLMNLLTNGRDALNERYSDFDENKKLVIRVRTFEKENIKWMRMTVEDQGIGVPEEIRDRIFDPFFTTKDRTKGTGLGLSISYGIVKEHLGEMSVESVANEYTRFHVDLKVNNGWTGKSYSENKNEKGA
jgi:PAS domain S-box-containing protein